MFTGKLLCVGDFRLPGTGGRSVSDRMYGSEILICPFEIYSKYVIFEYMIICIYLKGRRKEQFWF